MADTRVLLYTCTQDQLDRLRLKIRQGENWQAQEILREIEGQPTGELLPDCLSGESVGRRAALGESAENP